MSARDPGIDTAVEWLAEGMPCRARIDLPEGLRAPRGLPLRIASHQEVSQPLFE
jgi:hypothetical protein